MTNKTFFRRRLTASKSYTRFLCELQIFRQRENIGSYIIFASSSATTLLKNWELSHSSVIVSKIKYLRTLRQY